MPRRHVNRIHPSERFPTKPRKDGRFQKRINGHLYYFGDGSGDRPAALAEYDLVKADLYAGRTPRAWQQREASAGLTVKQMCNDYLEERFRDLQVHKIGERHYDDIQAAITRFCQFKVGGVPLGLRVVESLRPEDFADYGRALSRLDHHSHNRHVANIAAAFKHAADCDWIDRPVKFGRGFQKVSASKIRQARKRRLLESIHVKSLLVASHPRPQLWCMWMLGILCGFGPMDLAKLRVSDIDWRACMIRNRRPKTGIPRDAPLTVELVDGLRLILAKRPEDVLVFRTRQGNPWSASAIAHEFAKILIGFAPYDLRRSFFTYADELDGNAGLRIGGRRLRGLDDTYIQAVVDARLRKVVAHVYSRVLA